MQKEWTDNGFRFRRSLFHSDSKNWSKRSCMFVDDTVDVVQSNQSRTRGEDTSIPFVELPFWIRFVRSFTY